MKTKSLKCFTNNICVKFENYCSAFALSLNAFPFGIKLMRLKFELKLCKCEECVPSDCDRPPIHYWFC